MINRLSTRLWLTYILLSVVILCVISTGLLLFLIRSPAAARQLNTQLQIAANLFQAGIRISSQTNPEKYAQAVTRADENYGFRFIILNSAWQIVADSKQGLVAELPARINRTRLSLEQTDIPRGFVDADKQSWLYAVRKLPNDFFLIVAAPRPTLTLRAFFRDEFLTPFIQAGIVAGIISLILATSISQWIAKPLEKMASMSTNSALGSLDLNEMTGPTEVQELARALNDMNKKVRLSHQSQRDFVANVSHDLKTPLTSIQGFTQAILDGTIQNPDQLRSAAQVIYAESDRMHRMIVDLLELARLDSGIAVLELAPLDLIKLLGDVIERFTPQLIAKNIELIEGFQPLPLISADRDRLFRVFSNLLDNAIKFTPASGKVQIIAYAQEQEAVISVHDNGPGITETDLGRIFDRFYQTDKTRSGAQRGVGLGLSITKEIISAHGGEISVQNSSSIQLPSDPTRPHGSIFTVKLPFSRSDDITLSKQRQVGKPS